MTMKKKDIFVLTAGAILLVGVTAGASAYYMNQDDMATENERTQRVSHVQPARGQNRTIQTQTQPNCDDDNIVGKVLGGAAGGLAGSQVGSGSGKTAATIGGSVGGTVLGEKYIPTDNATCR